MTVRDAKRIKKAIEKSLADCRKCKPFGDRFKQCTTYAMQAEMLQLCDEIVEGRIVHFCNTAFDEVKP